MSSDGSAASPGPGAQPATGGRPSAVQPEVKLERRVPPFYGLFFYGFLFSVAWVWTTGLGMSARQLWMPRNLALEIAVGLGAGLVLVVVTPWATAGLRSLRELEREFGWILGQQRAWECVYLAILSGVAEEFFFRGAMLHAMKPWMALVVFACLHWPINAQWRAWPFTALLAGTVLTAEQMWTGTLIAPTLTHVMANAVNMLRITRKYREWKE